MSTQDFKVLAQNLHSVISWWRMEIGWIFGHHCNKYFSSMLLQLSSLIIHRVQFIAWLYLTVYNKRRGEIKCLARAFGQQRFFFVVFNWLTGRFNFPWQPLSNIYKSTGSKQAGFYFLMYLFIYLSVFKWHQALHAYKYNCIRWEGLMFKKLLCSKADKEMNENEAEQ